MVCRSPEPYLPVGDALADKGLACALWLAGMRRVTVRSGVRVERRRIVQVRNKIARLELACKTVRYVALLTGNMIFVIFLVCGIVCRLG